MQAQQLTDPVAFHGEGPVWSPAWGGLRWVDMLAGDILSLEADGTVRRRHVGEVAAAVHPRRAGGAVIGVERGFLLEEPDGALRTLEPLWSDAGVRMNEGGCDPDGRFYCGSMAYDQTPGACIELLAWFACSRPADQLYGGRHESKNGSKQNEDP